MNKVSGLASDVAFRTGHRDLMRKINENLLLNLVRSQGPISRAELAKRTELSPATVSQIAQVLLDSGFIEDIGEGSSSGGRRPTLLKLKPSAGFVAGLKLSDGAASVAVTDLNANVVHFEETAMTGGASAGQTLKEVNKIIRRAIKDSGVDADRVLGIGVGLGGVVDAARGVCHHSTILGWRDVDVASPIGQHFDLPVYIDNDVNTLTIAEQWFGHGRGVPHFVVVTVGRGVGMGIVTNGQFYRGAGGGAGEAGHMRLSEHGTLEDLASDPSVIKRMGAEHLSAAQLYEAAQKGDSSATRALAEAGRWLGIGIANIINTLNPALVIVGGEGIQAGAPRLDAMHEAIRQYTYEGLAPAKIVIEYGGNQTWARGAASLVLDRVFQTPVPGSFIA